MQIPYKTLVNSDNSLLIVFVGEIGISLTQHIMSIAKAIDENPPQGLIEYVPAYDSLLLIFTPQDFDIESCCQQVENIISSTNKIKLPPSKNIEIPVCYDLSLAPDLNHVADYCNISPQELIKRHCAVNHPVLMLGFLPGFLYLGGLDGSISCPRRETPRKNIMAGSVGIAGNQTGIYPVNSPGGWQIIGKTPTKMFSTDKEQLAIAQPLDKIRFRQISLEEFNRLQGINS